MTDPFADFFGEAKATLPKADAFKLLDAAIPKRSTLPCLQRVRITGEPGYLTFEGTDLDFAVSVRTGNFLDLEGSTTVDWKEFKAKHDTFPVSDMENHPVEDYPALPEPDGELVGTEWIEDGLKVLYAVSTDNTRLTLNGVYVHADGVVATDGHRLHMVKGSHALDAIIPPKVFKVAGKLGTPTEAKATERTLHLVYPWGHIASKVIEGPYPNYRQINPALDGRVESGRVECLIPLATLKDAASKSCEIEKAIPKGAQRLRVSEGPTAAWAPSKVSGKVVESVPQDGFIYRAPKPLQAARAPKEAKPREIVLELLSDGKGHEFPEIHSVLTAKVGKRTEKATRVLLQDLKDSGLLTASAVEYSKVPKVV